MMVAVRGAGGKSTECTEGFADTVLEDAILGKFAFGDRTIPIHARTLGSDVHPQRMWTCTTVRYGLQWCTLTRPPLERTHTSNPAFPTGGGLGGFVFLPVAVLDVVAAPVEGGGPTLPLWGRVVTLLWYRKVCFW